MKKKNDSITSKRPKWQFSSGLKALLTTDYHSMASSGMIKPLRPNGIDPQKVAHGVGVHIAPWLKDTHTNIIICEYIIIYIYIYIYSTAHTYVYIYIHTYIHTYVRTYIHTYIYIYICVCVLYTVLYICLYLCMFNLKRSIWSMELPRLIPIENIRQKKNRETGKLCETQIKLWGNYGETMGNYDFKFKCST